MPAPLHTPRLELVPATAELARADLQGPAALAALLGTRAPDAWPPEGYDLQTRAFFVARLEQYSAQAGWWGWYWVRREGRELLGLGGFKGPPSAGGEVELGYSVLVAHWGQGYASEATGALVAWAFSHPDVHHVAAECHPHNAGSLRVIQKCGLRYVREGDEPGTRRFLRGR